MNTYANCERMYVLTIHSYDERSTNLREASTASGEICAGRSTLWSTVVSFFLTPLNGWSTEGILFSLEKIP